MKAAKKDSAKYVLGVAALWVFYAFVGTMLLAGCDDGQDRHAPETCHRVVYAACLSDSRASIVNCALLAADGSRHNGRFWHPVIEGDEVCGHWYGRQ